MLQSTAITGTLGITTMTTTKAISPLGESASEGAARRAARRKEYREHAAMLAPSRVIARAVILARTNMGITQEQLGAALGTTGSAISRIESGSRPVTLDTLGKLGAALDITFVVGSPRAAGVGCVVVPQDAIEVSAEPVPDPPLGGGAQTLPRADCRHRRARGRPSSIALRSGSQTTSSERETWWWLYPEPRAAGRGWLQARSVSAE